MARVQQKSTRQNHRYEPNIRPSLRDGFNAYTYSPRGPAVLPPSFATLAKAHRELSASTAAPGPHDFTSASMLFVRSRMRAATPMRPSHPAPNVRDDRETPLVDGHETAENVNLICPTTQRRAPAAK